MAGSEKPGYRCDGARADATTSTAAAGDGGADGSGIGDGGEYIGHGAVVGY